MNIWSPYAWFCCCQTPVLHIPAIVLGTKPTGNGEVFFFWNSFAAPKVCSCRLFVLNSLTASCAREAGRMRGFYWSVSCTPCHIFSATLSYRHTHTHIHSHTHAYAHSTQFFLWTRFPTLHTLIIILNRIIFIFINAAAQIHNNGCWWKKCHNSLWDTATTLSSKYTSK